MDELELQREIEREREQGFFIAADVPRPLPLAFLAAFNLAAKELWRVASQRIGPDERLLAASYRFGREVRKHQESKRRKLSHV